MGSLWVFYAVNFGFMFWGFEIFTFEALGLFS